MTHRSVRGVRARCLTVVAGTVLAVYASAAPAGAHNVLTSTTPASGAAEAVAPAAVVLTFDQPVIALGTRVVVTGPAGPVQTGPPRLVDNTVSQPVQPAAPAGDYTVRWRVTSVDGHPVSGSFRFTAAQPGLGQAAEPVEPGVTPDPPAVVGRTPIAVVLALLLTAAAVPLGIALRRRRRRDTVTPEVGP